MLLALAIVAGGCAAGIAFRKGDAAMRAGSLDEAVAQYRRAVLADPDNPNYKIALERASQAASRAQPPEECGSLCPRRPPKFPIPASSSPGRESAWLPRFFPGARSAILGPSITPDSSRRVESGPSDGRPARG